MDERDFNELAGRIEGLGRSFMLLVSMLDECGIVNGPCYCEALREQANGLRFEADHLESTRRTMLEASIAIDGARSLRRSMERLS